MHVCKQERERPGKWPHLVYMFPSFLCHCWVHLWLQGDGCEKLACLLLREVTQHKNTNVVAAHLCFAQEKSVKGMMHAVGTGASASKTELKLLSTVTSSR
jgi:hypothetical protein